MVIPSFLSLSRNARPGRKSGPALRADLKPLPLRPDPEFYVALQRPARCSHGHEAGSRAGWDQFLRQACGGDAEPRRFRLDPIQYRSAGSVTPLSAQPLNAGRRPRPLAVFSNVIDSPVNLLCAGFSFQVAINGLSAAASIPRHGRNGQEHQDSF